MIEFRCVRCRAIQRVVDQMTGNCVNCGGALVPIASRDQHNSYTPQQDQSPDAELVKQHADERTPVPPVAAAGQPTERVPGAAHETPETSTGFDSTADVQQSKKAYCPGCGALAVVESSATMDGLGEFQLTCKACHSCWNLKPAAARHALGAPHVSRRGEESRPASAARLNQPSDTGMALRNPAQLLNLLTERQREVMDLVVAGKANKQTAHILGLSEKTVERHRANLMRRLGVKNVVDLVRLHLLTTGQIANSSARTFTTADAGHQESR